MTASPIGLRVRARRKEIGLTQAALAARVGVSASYLNLIENGKRGVGGALLTGIAAALETDLDALDDEEGRRLAAALAEIATEPIMREARPDRAALTSFVGRHPDWARATLLLHRAYAERDRTATALADRLSQDPVLQEDLHRLVSHVAAISSASEILEDASTLSPAQLQRFLGMIRQESGRLAGAARAVTGFFDKVEADRGAMTPAEEVDEFIAAHQNHFPSLESAAEAMRRDAALAPDAAEERIGAALRRQGWRIETAAAAATGEDRSGVRRDPYAQVIHASLDAPAPSRRFALTRLMVEEAAAAPIDALAIGDPRLRAAEARRTARKALANYLTAAILAPYDEFFAAAERLRYDIEALANRFSLSIEQTAHRLTTLRRPGREGAPFGFMRVDPAGYVTKRLPLPGMPLPRLGGACPLWAAYRAFQTPGRLVTQAAEFPTGERFILIAITQEKTVGGVGPKHLTAIQLACDAFHADRLIYGAAFVGARRRELEDFEPVGTTCRLCPRNACPARQEPVQTGGA